MALVAWHHVERCARVSLAAAFDFTAGTLRLRSARAPTSATRPRRAGPLTRTQGRRWRRSDASNAIGRTGKRPERFGPPGDPTAIPRRGRATMPSRPGRAPPGPAAEHARRATSGRGRAPRRRDRASPARGGPQDRPAPERDPARAAGRDPFGRGGRGGLVLHPGTGAGRHPAERDPRCRGGLVRRGADARRERARRTASRARRARSPTTSTRRPPASTLPPRCRPTRTCTRRRWTRRPRCTTSSMRTC